MMKKNGFTFVELLAMLTIIGILMVVAIPNISGILKNQRLESFKRDAKNMVETAKMKVNKDRLMARPKVGECQVFTLDYLNDDDNITKGPNGGLYNQFDSLVIYTREGSKYKYYVRLVEEYKNKRLGITLLESTRLNELKTKDVKEVGDNTGLTEKDNRASGIAKLNVFGSITEEHKCSSIIGYYSGANYCTYYNGIYYDDLGNPVSASRYEEVCS